MFFALLPKILPVGALLKYALVEPLNCGSSSALTFDGMAPTVLYSDSSPSLPVRYLMSSNACFLCVLCSGMARYEPPQLPPLPGIVAMSHLPAAPSPAFCLMTPVYHAGHGTVAKAPFWNAAVQSSDHRVSLSVRPSAAICRPKSHAFFTTGLVSPMNLLSLS